MSKKKKSGKKSKKIIRNAQEITARLLMLGALLQLIETALRLWGG